MNLFSPVFICAGRESLKFACRHHLCASLFLLYLVSLRFWCVAFESLMEKTSCLGILLSLAVSELSCFFFAYDSLTKPVCLTNEEEDKAGSIIDVWNGIVVSSFVVCISVCQVWQQLV